MKKWTLVLLLFLLLLAFLGPNTVAQGSGGQGTPEKPGTFVPTEKLPADSAISFPVDI